MQYKGRNICGANLGRHTGFPEECEGYNRICYGHFGHRAGHGNDDWPGQAEILLSDVELAELTSESGLDV